MEVEVKVLEINKEEIINILEIFGAKKIFEGEIIDIYYDFIEENLDIVNLTIGKMKSTGRSFRVRKQGQEFFYTIKFHHNISETVKVADEFESPITNFDGFIKTLENYGMKKTREKKKYRISYKFEDFVFDIDKYDNIPTFLEIEGKNETKILEMIKKLSLENYTIVNFGYERLLDYYNISNL